MTRRMRIGTTLPISDSGKFRGTLPDLERRVAEDYALERGAKVVRVAGDVIGKVVWIVAQYDNGHRCLAMEEAATDGGGQWWLVGRSVCAHLGDGPPILSCPLPFLDLVPELPSDWCRGVRAHHGIRPWK